MSIIDYVFQSTTEYIDRMPKSLRKKYGQFLTSPKTAAFMANLFTIPIRIQYLFLIPVLDLVFCSLL